MSTNWQTGSPLATAPSQRTSDALPGAPSTPAMVITLTVHGPNKNDVEIAWSTRETTLTSDERAAMAKAAIQALSTYTGHIATSH